VGTKEEAGLVAVRERNAGAPNSSGIRVSIIVATHFRPQMLTRLLTSLSRQTYPKEELELIVVGAAADPGRDAVGNPLNTGGLTVDYRVVGEDVLRSVSYKRNVGAQEARGQILAFIDDDCVADEDWISAAVPLFSDPKVGGVEGAIRVAEQDPPTPTYRASLRLALPKGFRTGNMFYRRSVFETCGGFDESLPYYEDTDLGYTVLEDGYLIPYCSAAVVTHPVHPGRPLWLLKMARSVDHLPYLFAKHRRSLSEFRSSVPLFNRSHYLYFAVYFGALVLTLYNPVQGALALGLGLVLIVTANIAMNWWGLHFGIGELALTALCLPLVPLVRLLYWLKGLAQVSLGLRKQRRPAAR
jgi:GT2 family glycosyltransferase